MSETIILELNQRNSEYSRPGEFRCQLAQPIIVNEGDQLSFRQASLDTLKTASDTIIITEDTTLSAMFSYYDVDYSIVDKARYDQSAAWLGDGSGNPTFDYFAAYNNVGTAQLTTITAQILGYKPPQRYDGFNWVVDYTVPGGSFIVGTFGTGSTVDQRVNFIVTFSYIDENNDLKFFKCSASTAQILPDDPDFPWGAPNYGTLSPQQLNQQYGGFFELKQLNGSPLNNLNIVYKVGTFKLAGIAGFWPGKYLNNDGNNVKTFGPTGSNAPQGSFESPDEGSDYDPAYAILASQFRFVEGSTPVSTTGVSLDLQNVSVVLKAGKYDPNSLAVKLTQLFSEANGLVNVNNQNLFQPNNPLLTRTDGPLAANMLFRRMNIPQDTAAVTFSNADTYSYFDWAGDREPIPYFIGANTFAVEYGPAGPVYQLSFAHTPFSNPSRPGEQDLGVFHYTDASGVLQYNVVKSAGGIAFHDLQPESFWQNTLGLRNKLIVPLLTDNSGVQYYDSLSLKNNITEGFHGLGTFFLAVPEPAAGQPWNDPRKVFPIPPAANPEYINVTGQSKAIIGDSPQEGQTPFYLIECLNVFRRTGAYLDDEENRINICAVASTQYLNANTVTVFSDAGIPYIHRGEPYMISEATVRILDPVTKQVASGLGPNSCVFLQIDRALEVPVSGSSGFPARSNPQQIHSAK